MGYLSNVFGGVRETKADQKGQERTFVNATGDVYTIFVSDKAEEESGGPLTDQEKERYNAALRRKQLSLVLAGKMKAEDATELKALFN